MGEMVDMVLEGMMCQSCGFVFPNHTGYPRSCTECVSWNKAQARAKRKKAHRAKKARRKKS